MPDGAVEYVHLPIYLEELSRALTFTADDLKENRAGRLSASQSAAQLGVVVRSGIKSVVLVLLACGGVALWFVTGVTTVLGLIPLSLAALCLAWVAIFAWYTPPVWRDANAGVVSCVEGLVTPAERQQNIPAGDMVLALWSYY